VIRLGRISYVNMAPVFYRLDAEVEEIQGVPTDLNRRLVAGEIDLAPISSIEYARHADTLRILPRLCVSSEGAVDSIQLVSRVPLERVRTVAVTPESATSVVLTKVLLPEAGHVPLGEEADAKLLIGDAALKSAFEDPTPHYDLGRLWLERTGLPMVFAVWAVRKEYLERCPDIVHEVHRAFLRSRDMSLEHVDKVARQVERWEQFPAAELEDYFTTLDFSLGERQLEGVREFARRIGDQIGVPRVPEIALLD
jgi:chorismate dehydratase